MTPTAFVANIERVFGEAPVHGEFSLKVRQISPRFLWLPYDTVVLPEMPDPAFLEYVRHTIGSLPQVIVPHGIDPDDLQIAENLYRPAIAAALSGARVESYITDTRLCQVVSNQGARYIGGDPGETVRKANDKALFKSLAEGIVLTPPGVTVCGTQAMAEETIRRLRGGKDVYIRLTQSGGGLGNRKFTVARHAHLDPHQIALLIEDGDPAPWHNAEALVEDAVEGITWAPSVTTHTRLGIQYDTLQVTNDGHYWGMWSPAPPWVIRPQQLHMVGTRFAVEMHSLDYEGWIGIDLGLTDHDDLYGFEANARMTGPRHNIALGEHLFGPWSTWRSQGIVTKAMDKVILQRPMSFAELHALLAEEKVLATPDNPFGAYITVPPAGNVAGLQVFAPQGDYYAAHSFYQRTLAVVGNPDANREDCPLF